MAKYDIKYHGRDFESLKKGLIEFAKAYYPETYTDFNEASPGSMFIDMAAYVGDVLSYYTDVNFKESLLLHAQERRNILTIASAVGYKPKMSVPSQVTLDVYQLMPASKSGVDSEPDRRYALRIEPGLEVKSTSNNITFLAANTVDFTVDNVYDPIEFSVYSVDSSTNEPLYYLAKKSTTAISAQLATSQVTIGSRERFTKLLIETSDERPVISILSITDSDGNEWSEVPYLAQDTIFQQVENTALYDPDSAVYSNDVPFLLKYKRVPRRFITRVTEDGLEVQFGAGMSIAPDEELLATPDQIGLALPTGKSDTDAVIDPSNPMLTSAYGLAPSNTTLTITYYIGGGVAANVPANTITDIVSVDATKTTLPASTPQLSNTVLQSIRVNNPVAAVGGRNEETNEEIRQNALAYFSAQGRAVTREDYIVRCYSMPAIYGSVAKAYITPDEQSNIGTEEVGDTVANPLALNLYVLGYDDNKRCTNLNTAIKNNLKNYIDRYRMLTDSINVRDAFIINIGVKFSVLPLPNYNGNEVLLLCIARLKEFFNIDRWQISQPIVTSEILVDLMKVKGVQMVSNLLIYNITEEGYSDVGYDIKGATKNGVVYPSLDPAIFEIRYPDADIQGKLTTF
jgi:hypothetical protein